MNETLTNIIDVISTMEGEVIGVVMDGISPMGIKNMY